MKFGETFCSGTTMLRLLIFQIFYAFKFIYITLNIERKNGFSQNDINQNKGDKHFFDS